MPSSGPRVFSLDAVRTDGWFERIGQGIGSFSSLCDIIGERFFAFSMITGARVTALTVNRRNPDETVVDFVVGGEDGGEPTSEEEPQRLVLSDFRRRLVAALLIEGPPGPSPERDTDLEAIQLHIGVRYLLLAPLYGYSLQRLEIEGDRSTIDVLVDGLETSFDLRLFQQRMRVHVREELERTTAGQRSTIDLAHVTTAEHLAGQGDWIGVTRLLGSWPAPLAIFLRTPEGQMIAPETSGMIAKGLSLLATACVQLGELERGEEIYRLGVQYGHDGRESAQIFAQFGEAILEHGRAGEAIGLLRRARQLGATDQRIKPLLARAYRMRGRYVAAYACLKDAVHAGVMRGLLEEEIVVVESALGEGLDILPNFRIPKDLGSCQTVPPVTR